MTNELTARRQDSTQSAITSLNRGDYRSVLNGLQTTIANSVGESTPVRELMRLGAKESHVVASIALLITKAAGMLAVGGNLKPGQEVEISKMLLEEYPLSSIDDFALMLSAGVRGKYGDGGDKLTIWRFDVSVIFGWMRMYMAEWAEVRENLEKKKEKPAPEFAEISPETEKLVADYLQTIAGSAIRAVPKLTRKEIINEGGEHPQAKVLSQEQGESIARERAYFSAMYARKKQVYKDFGLEKLSAHEVAKLKVFVVNGEHIRAVDEKMANEMYNLIFS